MTNALRRFLDSLLFCPVLKRSDRLASLTATNDLALGKVGYSLTLWAILPIGIKSHVNVAVSPTYQCTTAVTRASRLYPVI